MYIYIYIHITIIYIIIYRRIRMCKNYNDMPIILRCIRPTISHKVLYPLLKDFITIPMLMLKESSD